MRDDSCNCYRLASSTSNPFVEYVNTVLSQRLPDIKNVSDATALCASLHVLKHSFDLLLKPVEDAKHTLMPANRIVPALKLAPLTFYDSGFEPTQHVLTEMKTFYNEYESKSFPVPLEVKKERPVAHIVAAQWNEDHKWLVEFCHVNGLPLSHCTKYRTEQGRDDHNLECTALNVTNESSAYVMWILNNWSLLESEHVAEWIMMIHGHDSGWHQLHKNTGDPIVREEFLKQALQEIEYATDSTHYVGINFCKSSRFGNDGNIWLNGGKEFVSIFFPETSKTHEYNPSGDHDCCAQFVVRKKKIIELGMRFWKTLYMETLDDLENKVKRAQADPVVGLWMQASTAFMKGQYISNNLGFTVQYRAFQNLVYGSSIVTLVKEEKRKEAFALLREQFSEAFPSESQTITDNTWNALRRAIKVCSKDVVVPYPWWSAVAMELLWTQLFAIV